MIKLKTWEDFKSYFEDRFKISGQVLDNIAVYDVLLMFLSGLSNTDIADSVELDIQTISDILMDYFGFAGWDELQEVSYWFLFNFTETKEDFLMFLKNYNIKYDPEKLYYMCILLKKIEVELDKWYEAD